MGALRELLARFDVEVDPKGALKKGASGIDALALKLRNLGAMVSGAVVLGGIKSFIDGLADTGDQIIDTSARLGIATEEFQRWGLAAKLSGVEAGVFAASIKKLQLKAAEAAEAGAVTGGVFAELGVKLRDGVGGPMRDTTDIMRDTGLAISRLADPFLRAYASTEAFGKAGSALGPIFANGEAGLQDLLSEMDRLGGGYSDEALEKMGELGDNTDRWDFALGSLKGALAEQVLPAINNMIAGGAKLVASFKNSAGATTHLKAALVVLGFAAAAAGWAALVPWIPFLAMLALGFFVVDDLMTALAGGDSVIGRVLDKLLGEGAGKSIFKEINKDLSELNATMAQQPTLWGKISAAAAGVGSGIATFFKKDIPEAIGFAFDLPNESIEAGWKGLIQNLAAIVDGWIAELKGKIEKAIGIPITDIQKALGIDPAESKGTKKQAALDDATALLGSFQKNKALAEGGTPEDGKIQNVSAADRMLQQLQQNKDLLPSLAPVGFATSRANEEFGTRVNENSVTVTAPVTINVADGEGAVDAIRGHVGSATKRATEAALRTAAPEK